MKASAAELLRRLPGPVSPTWPSGERFVAALAHGTMSVEPYAPVGNDPQTPHVQDELYLMHSETGAFSADFSTRVVFWGPPGGGRPAPPMPASNGPLG